MYRVVLGSHPKQRNNALRVYIYTENEKLKSLLIINLVPRTIPPHLNDNDGPCNIEHDDPFYQDDSVGAILCVYWWDFVLS